MATLVTGGLRKVIADYHQENPENDAVNRLGLGAEIFQGLKLGERRDYYEDFSRPSLGICEAIKNSEEEAASNPYLDRDEVVYQAVAKALRDNEPSDWVLPDPDAHWNAHIPYATPNFGI